MRYFLTIIFFSFLLVPSVSWAQEEEEVPQGPDPKAKEKIQAARVAYLTDQLGAYTGRS